MGDTNLGIGSTDYYDLVYSPSEYTPTTPPLDFNPPQTDSSKLSSQFEGYPASLDLGIDAESTAQLPDTAKSEAPVSSYSDLSAFTSSLSGLSPSATVFGSTGNSSYARLSMGDITDDSFNSLNLAPGSRLAVDITYDPQSKTYGIAPPTRGADESKFVMSPDGKTPVYKTTPGGLGSGILEVSDDGKIDVRITNSGLLDSIKNSGGFAGPAVKTAESRDLRLPDGSIPKSFAELGGIDSSVANVKMQHLPQFKGTLKDAKYVTTHFDSTTGVGTLMKADAGTPGARAWNSDAGVISWKEDPQSGELLGMKSDTWLALAPSLVSLATLAGSYFMGEKSLKQQMKLAREARDTQLEMLGMQLAARGSGGGSSGTGLRAGRV